MIMAHGYYTSNIPMSIKGYQVSDFISEAQGVFTALERFTEQLRSEAVNMPIWTPIDTTDLSKDIRLEIEEYPDKVPIGVKQMMVDSVIDAFEMISYVNGQAPQSTFKRAGLIGASTATIALAVSLNEAKDELANGYSNLVKMTNAISANKTVQQAIARDLICCQALRTLGYSRLHIKQASRHIPILPSRPLRVSFSRSHSHSSPRKMSIGQARERLQKISESPFITEQIIKLNNLNLPDETQCLRTVHKKSEVVVANTVLIIDEKKMSKSFKTPIPALYPCNDDLPLPEIGYSVVANKPTLPGVTGRRIRSDKLYLDGKYFLESLNAYIVR